MVPLMLSGARPVTGCICADGHFETACPSMAQARRGATEGLARAAGCSGACSKGSLTHGRGVSSCCASGNCCGRHKPSSRESSDPAVRSCGCCTPVLQAGPPALGSVALHADMALADALLLTIDVPHAPAVIRSEALGLVAVLAEPVDRVVRLRRLLI
jgi:hypothetical protein